MRLTFEARGRTFTLALERDKPENPELWPHENLEATTERANAFDFDDRPPIRLGFAGKRKP